MEYANDDSIFLEKRAVMSPGARQALLERIAQYVGLNRLVKDIIMLSYARYSFCHDTDPQADDWDKIINFLIQAQDMIATIEGVKRR